jgi:hypothetical protein
MPLDLPDGSPENSSISVLRGRGTPSADAPSSYTSSHLTSVLGMLHVARETRRVGEQPLEPVNSEAPDSLSRGVAIRSRIRGRQSLLTAQSGANTPASPLSGRRRESVRELQTDSNSLRRSQTTTQLQILREQSHSLSNSRTSLLRRELDGEDFLSRLSLLRTNVLSLSNELERAMDELALPFINSRGDNPPPRNHHRHSSMSTSPRVLENVNHSSNRRSESDISDKLEEVLYFLDMQRFLPVSLDKLLKISNPAQSFVAESSWLCPGGVYRGVQSFARGAPSNVPGLGRQFRATDSDPSKEWKVEVVIDQIDYSDMSIAGSMAAYDMPESEAQQKVTTFWTGEVNNTV